MGCCGQRVEVTASTRTVSKEVRRRLVEGRLTTEDTNTIPEHYRMLKHLERKTTADGGLITAED